MKKNLSEQERGKLKKGGKSEKENWERKREGNDEEGEPKQKWDGQRRHFPMQPCVSVCML